MSRRSSNSDDDRPLEERVDWNAALDSVQGRDTLLLELVQIFVDEYPHMIERIDHAIATKDAQNLQIYAHGLKGSLRYFGETTAGNIAFKMEALSRAGDWQQAALHRPRLIEALERLLPDLRRYCDGG